MDELEYLKKTKNEIITVDSLNKKRLKPAFGDDCFIRYLFSDEGNENIVLDFINGVMIDSNFKTFSNVSILNPSPKAGFSLNLTKYLEGKESVVDVPKGTQSECVTEDGTVVIIEIQTYSTKNFFERTLYYWSKNYSNILKHGENYSELKPVISINLIDDFLFDKTDNRMHTCYLLKEKINNNILTDHIQLHYVEIPKLEKSENIKKELKNWILFLKSNKEEDMSQLLKEDTIFEKAINKYNYFTDNKDLLNEYDRREAYLVYQSSLLRGSREDGFREGQIAMAKTMKNKNMDINLISEITGLSLEEIGNLPADAEKL